MSKKKRPIQWDPNNIIGGTEANNYWDGKEAFKFSGEDFHIGQSYDDEPAEVIECLHCRGKLFNVALGSYWTGIRCINCLYETCVHSG